MVVVARDATLPRLDVESVVLLEANEASCSPVGITSAFVVYQFPVTDCGTTMTVGVGLLLVVHLSCGGPACGSLGRAGDPRLGEKSVTTWYNQGSWTLLQICDWGFMSCGGPGNWKTISTL